MLEAANSVLANDISFALKKAMRILAEALNGASWEPSRAGSYGEKGAQAHDHMCVEKGEGKGGTSTRPWRNCERENAQQLPPPGSGGCL